MIRKAAFNDLPEIKRVYATARAFMAQTGNPTQWGTTYPAEDLLREDIQADRLFVWEEEGEIYAVFYFYIGEDDTYRVIEKGEWLSSAPYGTIHRIASDGRKKGVLQKVVTFCESLIPHLRIDTHENNKVMQRCLQKCGFSYRGIIYTFGDSVDDSMRLAYEKCV